MPDADSITYIDNGTIRLGVNRNLGGAITYLSRSGSDLNLVNSHDWGRQIQMSHYSGPVPFAPHGKQPKPEWRELGWNPIQSGDCFGNRSRILDLKTDRRSLTVRCIPMQWPLNNEPGECTFECRITLDSNTATVRSRLRNARSDHAQYPGRGQELPAVYTNGPWYRLMTYTGDHPFTGDKLTQIPPKFPWEMWQGTENWAALVNEADWGLGVWHPGVTLFGGGFAGKPGAGGPTDDPTGYIAPVYQEIIDHNIDYEFTYTLILGSLTEIRAEVYRRAGPSASPAPPTYHFKRDRQHWFYVNATDTGWPIHGELSVRLEEDDPQLIGPDGFWRAADAPTLFIEAAFKTADGGAEVFWKRSDAHAFHGDRRLPFAVTPDGKFRTYAVDLVRSPEYRGNITGLRIDPVGSGSPGATVRVRSIRLGKPTK